MKLKDLFDTCVKELDCIDDAEFEITCIFEDFLNCNKSKILYSNECLSDEQISLIKSLVQRRKNGEPLQYILGKWDFYDLTFEVGEGVLIPRPETELLVDFALDKLNNIENPVIFDLCAGSGCIGLTIAKHLGKTVTYLFEKEEAALKYLNQNIKHLNIQKTVSLKADIFNYNTNCLPKCDIIISNPPYIPACEIDGLQNEVHFEPTTALNGGKDGLDFYRCIAEKWVHLVRKGGYIALECGDGQSKDIIDIFKGKYASKEVIYDFNNIDRIVVFGI